MKLFLGYTEAFWACFHFLLCDDVMSSHVGYLGDCRQKIGDANLEMFNIQ